MLTKFYMKPTIALFSLCLYDLVSYPYKSKISNMHISTRLTINLYRIFKKKLSYLQSKAKV